MEIQDKPTCTTLIVSQTNRTGDLDGTISCRLDSWSLLSPPPDLFPIDTPNPVTSFLKNLQPPPDNPHLDAIAKTTTDDGSFDFFWRILSSEYDSKSDFHYQNLLERTLLQTMKNLPFLTVKTL